MEVTGLKTVTEVTLKSTNMQTISAEDFKKKYGTQGVAALKQATPKKGAIATAFQGGIDQFKSGVGMAKASTNPLQTLEAGLQQGAGLAGAAFSPLAPATQYIGKGIDYAADKISDNPAVQKFAGSKAGQTTARVAQDVGNTSTLLGLMRGGEGGAGVVKAGANATERALSAGASSVGKGIARTADLGGDLIPSSQQLVTHNISKALDLTPGDLSRIAQNTGHDVGTWVAENKLIGKTKAETKANIQEFYKQNYKGVRDEISKADQAGVVRDADSIPGYRQGIDELNKKTNEVPGLEKESAEIKQLANKKNPTLADVQRLKEMLDQHFSLYKVTGDVSEGVQKQGLANIRTQLKEYLETEVKNSTGADIKPMNNNVATGRSLADAINNRQPRGITRANINTQDLMLGIFGAGVNPLVGIAAVFAKKVMESPTARLRVAKYVDGLSEARKAAVKEDLESGKIPPELQKFVKKPNSSQSVQE